VEDSVIRMKELAATRITHERLVSHLRANGIVHLGEVKRVYFEAGGFFTLIRNDNDTIRSGLRILPEWDREFITEQQLSSDFVCSACGYNLDKTSKDPCPNCQNTGREQAVITLDIAAEKERLKT
jgi:uncharacterized membrane protein YcaP (DUF421 family)